MDIGVLTRDHLVSILHLLMYRLLFMTVFDEADNGLKLQGQAKCLLLSRGFYAVFALLSLVFPFWRWVGRGFGSDFLFR